MRELCRPLFLVGMMGCGKSTVGSRLAALLECPFLDLDEEIERFEGRTIPEIFASGGDAGFRVCETAALRRALAGMRGVVATGGGIVTREENIALMRENGLVIWLCRPVEEIIGDVRQDTRPNLAGDKAERMRTLYAAREALYQTAAHMRFDNRVSAAQSARALAQREAVRALVSGT